MRHADVTNAKVADDLGLTHSMVSRVRSGDRLPSVSSMVRIEKVFGWEVAQQVAARTVGAYAEQFEAVLAEAYGNVTASA